MIKEMGAGTRPFFYKKSYNWVAIRMEVSQDVVILQCRQASGSKIYRPGEVINHYYKHLNYGTEIKFRKHQQ